MASSSSWGDQAIGRLCEIIMDANDGRIQQIMENRHDLLDLLSKEELERVDNDLQLSLPFLAVHHDRPDMIRYLHVRGLDLSKPCDSIGYGTPMFYAVSMSRHAVAMTLYALGVQISVPCETFFNMLPLFYAKRKDDHFLISWIEDLNAKENKAREFFRKNFLRNLYTKKYHRKRVAAIHLQRIARGRLARKFARALKAGDTIMTNIFRKDKEKELAASESGGGPRRATTRATISLDRVPSPGLTAEGTGSVISQSQSLEEDASSTRDDQSTVYTNG